MAMVAQEQQRTEQQQQQQLRPTYSPPRENGDDVAPGTPTKRTQGPGAFIPVATKRQRSFPTTDDVSSSVHLTGTHEEQVDEESKGMPSPVATVLRMEHERRASSPGVLKSSLKNVRSSGISTTAGTALDSPTESDKRGMYHDYVQNALADKQRGRDAGYLELIAQFSLPSRDSIVAPPPLGLLQVLLHALTGVASKLDKKHHSLLVKAILTLPWATMGGDVFARTWTRFVCTLCSARNEWVGEVLMRAVKALSYRSDWRSMAYAPGGPSNSKPTRRIIYARIHSLLRSLLGLIPTIPAQLGPLIVRQFPHKGEGLREHVVYVQNMFDLCEYAAELRSIVLECVIGRSLEIDVEIQIELDELEEAEADFEDAAGDGELNSLEERDSSPSTIGQDIFDKPLDDDSDSDDDHDEDDDDDAGLEHLDSDNDDDDDDLLMGVKSQTERQRLTQVRALADKLDAIMSTLFASIESVDSRLAQASKGLAAGMYDLAPGQAIALRNEQFSDLVRIFERTLLPTFKSRHVQFLLFWFASLERNFSDLFVGMLLSKAIYSTSGGEQSNDDDDDDDDAGPNSWNAVQEVPTVMRIAASSYVASLVSRAKFVDAQDARVVMLNLCAFLDAHLDAHPASHTIKNHFEGDVFAGPHAIFYAVAQACFYIFCFRWRDLRSQLEDDEEDANEGQDGEMNDEVVQWCTGMESIKRAVLSHLNPLAYCSSAVVRQFAGVAQLTGFMYCWNVIERNSRTFRRQKDGTLTPTMSSASNNNSTSSLHSPMQRTNSTSQAAITMNKNGTPVRVASPGTTTPPVLAAAAAAAARPEMDSFFPFDPYRLRGSLRWIEPIYREWSDVAPDGMVDDEDDEDEESEDDDDKGVEEESDSEDEEEQESLRSSSTRTALNIPSNGLRHKPLKPSKLAHAHGRSFGASVSTDESGSVAQSLEAMSISPRYT